MRLRPASLMVMALLAGIPCFGAEAAGAKKDDAKKEDDKGTEEVTVRLKDGTTVTGTVVQREKEEPVRDDTRLFLAPTGRPLRGGEGYFSDHWIFFTGAAYGVNDNFTLAGGVSVIPFIGLDEQAMYFTPKAGLRLGDRAAVSVGGLFARVGNEDDTLKVGYAVTTFGTSDHSLTAGVGVGQAGDSDTEPMLMVGGSTRLSKRIALMTENWFFPSGDFQLLSGGLRFRGGRLTVDLAFLTSPDAFEDLDGVPLIPWLSFSYHFDGRGERAASASK
jgi:hypothetical protein